MIVFYFHCLTLNLILVPTPATITNITTGLHNKTSLVVHWNKPNGGDEIDVYEVTWSDDSDTFLINVTHEKGTVSYKHEINGLVSGQTYSILVATYNFGGVAMSPPIIETTRKLTDNVPHHVNHFFIQTNGRQYFALFITSNFIFCKKTVIPINFVIVSITILLMYHANLTLFIIICDIEKKFFL